MRDYFETCICDFGAQSNSNSHGRRWGRRRICRQVLRASRISLTQCLRRASRGPLPSCRPSSSRCLLDPALLHELWRSVGCAGCPRDAQVRRLCICCHHVGDGNADASVARPRNSGRTLCRPDQGRPTLPLGLPMLCFPWKASLDYAQAVAPPSAAQLRENCLCAHAQPHTRTHTHACTHTHTPLTPTLTLASCLGRLRRRLSRRTRGFP